MHSLVMTVRTVVMLACMIALPLAAVFWPTISEQLRHWLADAHSRPRHAARDEGPHAPASVGTDQASTSIPSPTVDFPPPLNDQAVSPVGVENTRSPEPGGAPARQPQSLPNGSRQPVRNMSEWSKQSNQIVQPTPMSESAGGAPALAGPLVPMSATSADLAASRVQQAVGAVPRPAPPTEVGSSALPRADHADIHAGLSRLRELGANYYRLETDGRQYHFSCDVAVSVDSSREKRFTASAAEPRQAVAQVLAEVKAWRGPVR